MSISHDEPQNCAGFDLPEVLRPDIYAELRKLAAQHMLRQRKDMTLQPTGLVHEAWLHLARQGRKWRDQSHFFATASVTMRHILIDQARRKSRLCRGGGLQRINWLALGDLAAPDRSDVLLVLDEAITELEKINAQRAQVVVDRFFGGLTNHEIAERLEIGERSVERHWSTAKVWLLRWMQKAYESRPQAVA